MAAELGAALSGSRENVWGTRAGGSGTFAGGLYAWSGRGRSDGDCRTGQRRSDRVGSASRASPNLLSAIGNWQCAEAREQIAGLSKGVGTMSQAKKSKLTMQHCLERKFCADSVCVLPTVRRKASPPLFASPPHGPAKGITKCYDGRGTLDQRVPRAKQPCRAPHHPSQRPRATRTGREECCGQAPWSPARRHPCRLGRLQRGPRRSSCWRRRCAPC